MEEWQTPQLMIDGMTRDDIKQGILGDCWFLSSCAAVSQREKYMKKVTLIRIMNFLYVIIFSKILNTSGCLPKRPRQTAQTQNIYCFCRCSLITVFPACYSDKHVMNFNPVLELIHLRTETPSFLFKSEFLIRGCEFMCSYCVENTCIQ